MILRKTALKTAASKYELWNKGGKGEKDERVKEN
jgi:hypothetical protein